MPRLPPSLYLSHIFRTYFLPFVLVCAFSYTLYSVRTDLGSPGMRQRVGWQSWDVVQYANEAISSGEGDILKDVGGGQASDGEITNDSPAFAPSYDLETWDPLIPHTTGLTAITVVPCYLPAWLYPTACSPPTTRDEDARLGRWVRVERDLNLKSGLWYLNVYYRRTRRFDAPLITDLVWLQEGETPPGRVNLSEYSVAGGDFRNGVWPTQKKKMRLWYKTKKGNPYSWWWKQKKRSKMSGDGEEESSSEKKPLQRRGAGEGELVKRYYRPSGQDRTNRRGSEAEAETKSAIAQEETWEDWDLETGTGEYDDTFSGAGGTFIGDEEIITEIDVLYGDGPPFFGFHRVGNGPLLDSKGAGSESSTSHKWDSVDLVYRKGNPIPPFASTLRFNNKGKFKILQIADLHYSVSAGKCRDTLKSPCIGDIDTAKLIAEALDAENPDLVVFSGDQLNGQGSSYDAKSVIAKYAKPVIDRKIPWAMIFGNHDSEIANDRAQQMRLVQSMPYSISEPGPTDVDGIGNYFVKIYSPDSSYQHIFSLYFLDSHSHQPPKWPWLPSDYDFLKPSQISWFLNTSEAIKPIERPFTPDGADDLGKVWRKKDGLATLASLVKSMHKRRLGSDRAVSGAGDTDNEILAKPNAIMFFHIPIEESYGPVDEDEVTGQSLDIGEQLPGDGPGNSKTNGGMYQNGLKKAMEIPMSMSEEAEAEGFAQRTEVKIVGHGHSHNTDKCRRVGGIWFCFGGGSSYSGYGSVDFPRRFRVYEISEYGEKVETYKRTEDGEIIDRSVLVGEGAPSGVGM